MLEEGSFRGRTADFVFMFLFGGVLMTVSFHFYFNDPQTTFATDYFAKFTAVMKIKFKRIDTFFFPRRKFFTALIMTNCINE